MNGVFYLSSINVVTSVMSMSIVNPNLPCSLFSSTSIAPLPPVFTLLHAHVHVLVKANADVTLDASSEMDFSLEVELDA